MPVKTDRRGAEGIARWLHPGWVRPVHRKPISAQEGRALVTVGNQSGERDVPGHMTKAGEVGLRRALCPAATAMVNRGPSNWPGTRATRVARRRGRIGAMVALARRIAVVLHRMWRDGTVFQSEAPTGQAT